MYDQQNIINISFKIPSSNKYNIHVIFLAHSVYIYINKHAKQQKTLMYP